MQRQHFKNSCYFVHSSSQMSTASTISEF